MAPDAYLNQQQAARYAGASRWTIHRASDRGELRSTGAGHLRRWRTDWIDEWLEQLARKNANGGGQQ